MEKAALTFQDFEALAKKHYAKGGSFYYETWDESLFQQYRELFGEMTEETALSMFRLMKEVEKEAMSWH